MNPILKSIADNPELTKALKEVILGQFTLEKDINIELDNESLGQVTR